MLPLRFGPADLVASTREALLVRVCFSAWSRSFNVFLLVAGVTWIVSTYIVGTYREVAREVCDSLTLFCMGLFHVACCDAAVGSIRHWMGCAAACRLPCAASVCCVRVWVDRWWFGCTRCQINVLGPLGQ